MRRFRYGSAALITALMAAGAWRPAASQDSTCVVKRVIDGDTLVCEGEERVRLIGIDSPELSQAPLGELARSFVAGLVPANTRLGIETDVQTRDRYRRLLAYLYLPDGRMLNLAIVRAGYAQPRTVPPNVRYVDGILDASREARESGAGLWSLGEYAEPLAAADLDPDDSPDPKEGSRARCDASYPDVCIPPPPPDLDCGDIPHRRFRVIGPDPHRFDGDRDGIGCEG